MLVLIKQIIKHADCIVCLYLLNMLIVSLYLLNMLIVLYAYTYLKNSAKCYIPISNI